MTGEELDKFMVDDPEEISEDSSAPSPSNDVKPEVKQASDVPYVDEKGVPYFNRFKEMSEKLEKFKDIDPEKWAKVKDFDPEQVSRALELEKFMTSDKEKFQRALALYEEQQEAKEQAKSKEESTPKYLTKEEASRLLEEHEKQKELSRQQDEWMSDWRKSVDSSMLTVLKGESFKDFGELHDRDKKAVIQEVGEIFKKDAESKFPKLDLQKVPEIVSQVMKGLQEYRNYVRSQAIKKDGSPQSISGNQGVDSKKKAEDSELDENEEVKDMINIYKELSNPHI